MKGDTPTAQDVLNICRKVDKRRKAVARLRELAAQCPYPEFQEQLQAIAQDLAS